MNLFTKSTLAISTSILGLTLATASFADNSVNTKTVANTAVQQAKTSAPQGKAFGWKQGKGDMNKTEKGVKGGKGNMMARHMDELGLTDAQKTQLEQLRTQNQTKMQQLHTTLQQYDDNIAKQKQAGASTATLLALHKQKQAVMEQFFSLHQQQQQQFLNILTPEQQLKLYESQGMRKGMAQGR
ncbi:MULTISPECIES: Spy/CpxP family protein refolding chaperone [unclassified Moraxella]|uniref:Spy/CpxP family protein refolding chaperone n=1 Tax=unclassified Moraxella TaxID=2685852 RepID=UPI003AF44AC6